MELLYLVVIVTWLAALIVGISNPKVTIALYLTPASFGVATALSELLNLL